MKQSYIKLNDFVNNNIESLRKFQTTTSCKLNRIIERGPKGIEALNIADSLYANFNKVIDTYNEELCRAYNELEQKTNIFDSIVNQYIKDNNIQMESFCIDECGILIKTPEVIMIHWSDIEKYRRLC